MSDSKKGINVLSLFDGMSCGQIALERAGIKVNKYYASEIDKYAIKVARANYPETIHLGDVRNVKSYYMDDIDIIIGGSPCQGFSFAGKQLNFDDPRSKLFFEMVRLIKECKPKHFLLENVVMKKEYQDVITKELGAEPILINSALVSAQNRKRLYWTNIPNIVQPDDEKVFLQDILVCGSNHLLQRGRGNNSGGVRELKSPSMGSSSWEQNVLAITDREKSYCIDANYFKGASYAQYIKKSRRQLVYDLTDKKFRKLTPVECERLQTVPDDYTNHVSNTQRYKMLGNGWTIDVIAHIFKGLKNV